jgi:ribonuclease HI
MSPSSDSNSVSHKKKPKWYVVWSGRKPGVYSTWADTSEQVTGVAGAQYKSFSSEEEARTAFAGRYADYKGSKTTTVKRSMAELADLGVVLDSIAVDAACAGVPGPLEYRGIHVETGAEIFRMGPYEDGTNNIGEFLGLVHALAFLHKRGKHEMPVYSDSEIALTWLRAGKCRTKQPRTARNAALFELIARAEKWLAENEFANPVLKWRTDEWGEIPADYGRK